ncbi:unnamed protein product [Phaeothamnion confervicola]
MAEAMKYPLHVVYCGVCGLPCEYCEYGSTVEACEAWRREHAADDIDSVAAGVAGLAVGDDSRGGEGKGGGGGTAAAGAAAAGGREVIAEGDKGGGGGGGDDEDDADSDEEGGAAAGGALAAAGSVGSVGAEGERRRKLPTKKPGGAKKGKDPAAQRVVIARINRNKRKYVTVIGGLDTVPDIKLKDAAKRLGKQFACGSSVSKTASGAEEIVIQGDVLLDLPDFLQGAFGIDLDKIHVLDT